MELIIASSNQNKLLEFKKILGDKINLYSLSDYNINKEIPEDEDTNKKNAMFKAKFIYENLQIQNNLIHGSYLAGIKNLIFLGSSCIYPGEIYRKIKEDDLLTGKLEKTNDAYAIAKIAGLIMCRDYSKNYNLNYKSLMLSLIHISEPTRPY